MLAGGTFHPLKLRLLRRLNCLSAARTIKLNLVHGDLSFLKTTASRRQRKRVVSSFHNFDFAPGKDFVQKKSHRQRHPGTNGARLCRGDQPQHERTSRCRLFLSRVPISRAAALCYWWHRPPACCFRRHAGNRLRRRLFFQRPPTRMLRLPAKFGGTPNLTGATPVPPKNTPAAAA